MQVILSRDCIEVLHVFASFLTFYTSFYMMYVNFYMHEIFTTLLQGTYKIFPCNIQNLNAADLFQFLHNFPWSM